MVASTFAGLLSMAVAHAGDPLRNAFDDPFLPSPWRCPTERGPSAAAVGPDQPAISRSSKMATARVQPAEAPRILCGKHET